MQFLYIRTCNSDFHAIDDGADYERPEDALSSAIEGAVGIVRDEVHRGLKSAAVEVCVQDKNGSVLLRNVVAISVSTLSIALPSPNQMGEHLER